MQDSFYTQKTVKVDEPSDIKVRDLGNGDQRRNQEPHDHMRTMHGMDAMLNNNHDYASGNFPKPQKKMLQTMGQLATGLDQDKINTTTENFIKNKHGVHIQEKIHTTMETKRKKVRDEVPPPAEHQYIVGYDSISDSSYVNIPHFFNADKVLTKLSS